jgi:hypothetical protein
MEARGPARSFPQRRAVGSIEDNAKIKANSIDDNNSHRHVDSRCRATLGESDCVDFRRNAARPSGLRDLGRRADSR